MIEEILCRGTWIFESACGHCKRCRDEVKAIIQERDKLKAMLNEKKESVHEWTKIIREDARG